MTGPEQVTTVVVTQDRWPDLQGSLPRHTGPVVLVDNASTDDTPRLVREHFPHIEVIELPENRGAVGRNVGVEAARTPYVAFADDDSWWAPGALETAVAHFESSPRLALLAARMLVGEREVLDGTCVQMAQTPLVQEPDLPGTAILGFVACGALVRREAYLAAGGFDDVVFFAGEEERLALDLAALGWGLAYVEEVVAHHHPSVSRHPRKRLARVARNRVLTAVMRRPWPVVAGTVRGTLGQGPPGVTGLLQTVPRVPMALRARRPLPARVEAQRRLLDGA